MPVRPALPHTLLALAMLALTADGAASAVDEPIKPVPLTLNQVPARADLGRRLFNDVRLSGNKRVSCATCHDVTRGGADNQRLSRGVNGKLTELNTPTVFNAALNFKQFWNGRVDTLEGQIEQVIVNPVEMGSDWATVVQRIAEDGGYQRQFRAAYNDGVNRWNIQNALASYERTLITPNARFDRYLRGDQKALSKREQAGYQRFKQFGCVACHQGVNVGGNMFQKFGVTAIAQPGRSGNQGRFLVTGKAEDRMVFKVPSLRNVAQTAPYLHDGSAATLADAIDVMFKVQLGRKGSKEDKELIEAFLNTLTAMPEVK
jgi:cytochrome c peroxidase